DEWRDPAVVNAYVKQALASDKTSKMRTPPSLRSPCGALEDSFYMATGRQLWDASLVTAPTLIVASERDFWSRPEDRELLAERLVHSARVKIVIISGATHFVHLDRPEHGRAQLLSEISDFLVSKCCLRTENLIQQRSSYKTRLPWFRILRATLQEPREVDAEKLHFRGSLLQ